MSTESDFETRTRPFPEHFGHGFETILPLPLHFEQTFVSEAEAWKILEKKARRRQERAEDGEAMEEQEPREMEVLK